MHGAFDKMYEYWSNSILSAATTQVANLTGNALHGTWKLTAERLIEATANLAMQRPEGAQFGELPHMIAGILPGLSRASQNFLMTWRTELPTLEYQLGREARGVVLESPGAIGGKTGRVVRTPWRLLSAADDFAKSLITEIEVGAHAYRIAKAEGKTGKDLQARIAELHANLESEAWDLAYDSALEAVFQQEGSAIGKKIKGIALKARKDVFGVRYLIPFVATPANIFETAIRKSPLGIVGIGAKIYSNVREGRNALDGMTPLVAQQLLVWSAVLALMGNPPDDPWITGAEESLGKSKKEVSYRSVPAMSVKLGGRWYSYSRIEPFATVLGLTVDGVNAFRSGDPKRTVTLPLNSLIGQLNNKTFLSGLGDIYEAFTAGEDAPERLAQWGSNFTTSWIPNIFRSASREADDTYMDRGVWGEEGADWWSRLGRRTLQKTELPVESITGKEYPHYDVWGRPAMRSESPAGSDWLYRIMTPVRNQDGESFVADRLIRNYNNTHSGQEQYPMKPRRYYRAGGETKYMTEGQYADYSRLAGVAARHALTKEGLVKLNPDNPTREQVDWIDDVCSAARAAVLRKLEEKWSGRDLDIDPEKIGDLVLKDLLSKQKKDLFSGHPERGEHETPNEYKDRVEKWKSRKEGIRRLMPSR
jgi:hypothetical protein